MSTYNKIEIDNDLVGFIKVSEQANDILIAVEERKILLSEFEALQRS